MRESLGSVALYNIIIVFIVVTFAILAGTMSYSKAFKVNNRIINAIEKYEGYNKLSANEIDQQLMSIGYQTVVNRRSCPMRNGYNALAVNADSLNDNYEFCIYAMPVATREWNGRYVEYGVVSYINIDFPVFHYWFKIPVYNVTRKIFKFNPESFPDVEEQFLLGARWNSLAQQNMSEHNGVLTFASGYEPNLSSIRDYLDVDISSTTGGSIGYTEYDLDVNETTMIDGYKYCQVTVMSDSYDNAVLLSYRVAGSSSCLR